jgi:hypothetical protein
MDVMSFAALRPAEEDTVPQPIDCAASKEELN